MANDGNGGNVTDPLLPPLMAIPTSSELKDRLIFGPYSHSGVIDVPSQHPSPSSRHGFSPSKSAPSVTITNDLIQPDDLVFHRSYSNSKSTELRQTVALVIVYLPVMSVATVVYGDQALKTLPGWLLAAIWLLVSALAVALAFFYLAKARMDKRNREWANIILGQNMSTCDFFAADVDDNGYLSASEYAIYKLTQVDKITYKDIKLITEQFDKMDRANRGKITLSDLLETRTNDLSTASPV